MPEAGPERAPQPGQESSAAGDTAAWQEVAGLLLTAAAEHAVQCGETDVEALRQTLRESIAELRQSPAISNAFTAVGAATQALARHAAQTQKQIDTLLAGADAVVQVLFQHIGGIYEGEESQPYLEAMRAAHAAGLRAGNLAGAREPIEAALAGLARPTPAAGPRAGLDQDRVPAPAQPSDAALPMDTCTGLPIRSEAEAALKRALEGGPQSYAAVFYLHRMPLINARFGQAIGDQVILFCSQHLASLVTRGNDALFRWSGPVFVAVLERPDSESAVAADVQRLLSAPLSRFFETSARSVYLPVKITGAVLPLFGTSLTEIVADIEQLVLTSAGH